MSRFAAFITVLDPVVRDAIDSLQDLPLVTLKFPRGMKRSTKISIRKIFERQRPAIEAKIMRALTVKRVLETHRRVRY